MWLTTVLDRLKNDFHIPIAILVFSVTTSVHVWTKRDLGPQYCNSLYAMYAFLGGHAYLNRDKGDSNDSSGTSGTPPTSGG